jgi:hypothetical protein
MSGRETAILKKVKTNGMVTISRIEIHDVISSPARNLLHQCFRQVTVGIKDRHASTGSDILEDTIAKERCFPRPALPDAINMLSAVGRTNTEGMLLPPDFPSSKVQKIVLHDLQAHPCSSANKNGLGARRPVLKRDWLQTFLASGQGNRGEAEDEHPAFYHEMHG